MDKTNACTRNKLKAICRVDEFQDILNKTMLSAEEQQILWMHYKDNKTLIQIAYELGMSEVSVKKKHKKLLDKISNVI